MNDGRQLLLGGSFLFALVAAVAVLQPPVSACVIIDPHPWPPEPPRPGPFRLLPIETRSHHVDVRIREQAARVHLRAVFFNPNPVDLEGSYSFPIAPAANVSSFSMKVDGRGVEAELLDADRARRIYEEIVRRRRDPALLEYVGDRMIRARVFPIGPRGEVEIELVYEELLSREAGLVHLHYPLRSAKPPAGSIGDVRIAVDLTSRDALKNVYSPTHEVGVDRPGDREANVVFEARSFVPRKDFDLYALANDDDIGVSLLCHEGAEAEGSFLLLLSPREELPAADPFPKRVVFVLDRSGSMSGRKIEQAVEALRFAVSSLGPADRFGILPFSTDVASFRDELVPATESNVREALAFVGEVRALGGTAIHDALLQALVLLGAEESGALPAIVFITDGRPSIGETRIGPILAEVERVNDGRARIFVFGVGDDANTDLLDRLARENRGTREYVRPYEDLEVKISNLAKKIASPVLADARLSFRGVRVSELYPRAIPDIFEGTQLAVVGRYEGAGRATVTLEGRGGGKKLRYEYDVVFGSGRGNGFLDRLWAVRKVAFLLEEIRLHGRDEELIGEIRRLGKRYGILTPYTSYLIVDESRLAGAPGLREELEKANRRLQSAFEDEKRGEWAVDAASAVARGGGTAAAPADMAERSLEELVGRTLKRKAENGSSRLSRAIDEEAMVRVGDKVLYAGADGFLYDSVYREGMRVEEVRVWSERYFTLLRELPGIGRYLALNRDLVVVIGGRAYRIAGHDR